VSYKIADDAYYPSRKYGNDGRVTISTTTGKRITYDPSNADEFKRYNPVKKVDPDGTVRFTNEAGDIEYKTKTRLQKSTKMAETDDAYTLVSEAKHPMEIIYADYANTMKSLGNQARKEMMATGKIAYDANAAQTYSAEVKSLKDKVNTALLNAPRERLAQIKTNAEIEAKKAADPSLKSGDIRKLSQQALTKYRSELQSVARSKRSIQITDREWEAIQAGAISESRLKDILNNTDIDVLRDRATPKTRTDLTTSKVNTIKAMSASNYTLEQIAKKLGVSTSTVHAYLNGKKGVND
jgi:DNA-binding NarL/FixJ family response regulator